VFWDHLCLSGKTVAEKVRPLVADNMVVGHSGGKTHKENTWNGRDRRLIGKTRTISNLGTTTVPRTITKFPLCAVWPQRAFLLRATVGQSLLYSLLKASWRLRRKCPVRTANLTLSQTTLSYAKIVCISVIMYPAGVQALLISFANTCFQFDLFYLTLKSWRDDSRHLFRHV
jgi:hypothetical protein